MDEATLRALIEAEVARQMAPLLLAFKEFSRRAEIGFRTIANGAEALRTGEITCPCPMCGASTKASRSPKGGLAGTCPKCGHSWDIY